MRVKEKIPGAVRGFVYECRLNINLSIANEPYSTYGKCDAENLDSRCAIYISPVILR
jgi:hypothetical protein